MNIPNMSHVGQIQKKKTRLIKKKNKQMFSYKEIIYLPYSLSPRINCYSYALA